MIAPFNHIYEIAPIDHWENALIPSMDEADRVLAQMPEEPRDFRVYKLLMFKNGECELFPVYLCKAENNGTVYIFSDIELTNIYYRRVK
jgi:hypothetical protein